MPLPGASGGAQRSRSRAPRSRLAKAGWTPAAGSSQAPSSSLATDWADRWTRERPRAAGQLWQSVCTHSTKLWSVPVRSRFGEGAAEAESAPTGEERHSMEIGYKLSSEEQAPQDLVENAQRAEESGFSTSRRSRSMPMPATTTSASTRSDRTRRASSPSTSARCSQGSRPGAPGHGGPARREPAGRGRNRPRRAGRQAHAARLPFRRHPGLFPVAPPAVVAEQPGLVVPG
jgi:hypothetical protein